MRPMKTDLQCLAVSWFLCLLAFCSVDTARAQQPASVTAEEAYEIGVEAYVYLYPLVSMDVSRKQFTNIEAGKMVGRGPMKRLPTCVPTPPPTSGWWCDRTSTRFTPRLGST